MVMLKPWPNICTPNEYQMCNTENKGIECSYCCANNCNVAIDAIIFRRSFFWIFEVIFGSIWNMDEYIIQKAVSDRCNMLNHR